MRTQINPVCFVFLGMVFLLSPVAAVFLLCVEVGFALAMWAVAPLQRQPVRDPRWNNLRSE